MKILVINGSLKGESSACLKLTRAFLEGMGETAEIVHAAKLDVRPCLGCYACWRQTPGVCAQKDDMAWLLPKMTDAELVIWSMPLYCYGMPANAKAVVDRMLPLTCPQQETDENGRTYHPTRQENHTRFMLISGCGFPNIAHNYEALLMQFGMMFHEGFPRILCVEAPLLTIPQAEPAALPYLKLARQAGEEFKRDGAISGATQARLDAPMFPPDEYRKMAGG